MKANNVSIELEHRIAVRRNDSEVETRFGESVGHLSSKEWHFINRNSRPIRREHRFGYRNSESGNEAHS